MSWAPTRRVLIGGIALAAVITSASAQVIDRLGVPGPLSFNGVTYALAWSSQPSPGYRKQEYLPAGQISDAYSTMLIVEVLENGASVEAALGAQVRMLNQRKGKDPLLNMSVLQNKQTGEALLDFIVSSRDAQGRDIAEWNAYRYAPRKSADGKTGVLLLAISRRAYGSDGIRNFLIDLKSRRPGEINTLARYALPEVR